MKPPFLSTEFSESGKKAKKRFENIFGKQRKMSPAALAAATILAALCTALVSCGSKGIIDSGIIGGADSTTSVFIGSPASKDIAEQLYKYKSNDITDIDNLKNILNILDTEKIGAEKEFEIVADKQLYGIIRNFSGIQENNSECMRQAAVLLCLTQNADFVKYIFYDAGGKATDELCFNRDDLDREFISLSSHAQTHLKFRDFYIKLYKGTTLDDWVASAILSANKNQYAPGELDAEGHIILGTEQDTNGNTVVYAFTTYSQFGFEDGNFVSVSGTGLIPTRITFAPDGSLIEYKLPLDGSMYGKSIKEIFPKQYHKTLLEKNDKDSYNECEKQEYAYAQYYLGYIGRSSAKIGTFGDFEQKLLTDAGVSVEVSNMMVENKELANYPFWLGNCERLENGIRYVYEQKLVNEEIIFQKYEYDTGTCVERHIFDAKTGERRKS